MNTIVISYDEKTMTANIVNMEDCAYSMFHWNEDFEIDQEHNDTDCEDINDTARWMLKTLLAILKMEKDDEYAHCDWSADCEINGNYKFTVKIEKIKGLENESANLR